MKNNKLKNWCEFLTPTDIQSIHNTSMKLLSEVGIRFPNDEALKIFKTHGVKTQGQIVHLNEDQVMAAITTVPSHFTLHARNPEQDVTIGDGNPVFAPGYGAPFLVDWEVGKRSPTLEDYQNLVRLGHMLPNQDISGHLMVMPEDIPSRTAHLEMLHAGIMHSDKAFIGSVDGRVGAKNTIEMAKILFGGKLDRPVAMGIINPVSPLGYSPDMIEALMIYAQAGQPCTVAALVMAGSTGPITLAGVLAQQNAEILAGITLAQLIYPGVPLVYGSTSTNVDMRTGALAIGSPELSLCISAHTQLARFYGLPSRGGGALTDSSATDAQAGFESMLSLLTTINSGVDFVLHAAGILSSYMAFSFEKFVLDDEMTGMLRRYLRGIEVTSDTLAFEVIVKVGHDGHFLGEPHTLERCRTEFWMPYVSDRQGLDARKSMQWIDANRRARNRWKDLLAGHQDPPLDRLIVQQMQSVLDKSLVNR